MPYTIRTETTGISETIVDEVTKPSTEAAVHHIVPALVRLDPRIPGEDSLGLRIKDAIKAAKALVADAHHGGEAGTTLSKGLITSTITVVEVASWRS